MLTNRLIIATHNNGKLGEFRNLLAPYVREIVSAGELGLPSPEETGTTCVENALIKVNTAAALIDDKESLVLADDSGVFVTALGGRPGVYAADWIKELGISNVLQRIHDELGDAADRSATFLSVLALRWSDGRTEIIEGRLKGTIAPRNRGVGGFDYDAIFIPDGHTRTFAEMTAAEKDALSHRGIASRALVEKFFKPR